MFKSPHLNYIPIAVGLLVLAAVATPICADIVRVDNPDEFIGVTIFDFANLVDDEKEMDHIGFVTHDVDLVNRSEFLATLADGTFDFIQKSSRDKPTNTAAQSNSMFPSLNVGPKPLSAATVLPLTVRTGSRKFPISNQANRTGGTGVVLQASFSSLNTNPFFLRGNEASRPGMLRLEGNSVAIDGQAEFELSRAIHSPNSIDVISFKSVKTSGDSEATSPRGPSAVLLGFFTLIVLSMFRRRTESVWS